MDPVCRAARTSTVLQLAKILSAAYHSRFAPEYMASLPLAGMDGTLALAHEK